MTEQEKIEAIKEAAKIYSSRQIDVPGKGKGIKTLQEGGKVSLTKLDAMLARIQELSKKGPESEEQMRAQIAKPSEVKAPSSTQEIPKPKQSLREEGKIKIMEKITKVVATQNEQIKVLTEQNKILQENLAQVLSVLATIPKQDFSTQTNTPKNTTKKKEYVLGFRLCQKTTVSNGKKYLKWYGYTKKREKQIWIYLGDSTLEAEGKIKAWLAKHPEMAEKLAAGKEGG